MTLLEAATTATRVRIPLADLGVAPENLRAAEPADENVPRLAETIRAAGLIYPPLVRRGRKGEAPFMVLDGRRRRFALLSLADQGHLAADHQVECLLAEGRAAHAAAAVLPNTEHVPVHPADVILAIGRLRKARMDWAAIAQALGHDEVEVRRLAALAGVHPDVLAAYRLGKLTLKQVRLFARLRDRKRQQALVEGARDGYFYDGALQAEVAGGKVTVRDARFGLVSMEAYAAAGGRMVEDLFGELPSEVLDAGTLEDLWRERAAVVADGLAAGGLTVHLARERGYLAPDGLRSVPFVHWTSLDAERQALFEQARAGIETAVDTVEGAAAGPGREAALGALLAARWQLARLASGDCEVRAVLLTPAHDGLDASFYCEPPRPSSDAEAEDGDEADATCDGSSPAVERRAEVEVPEVVVATAGVSHVQHQVRTDIATRGLIRDLADHPQAALVALIAQLFQRLALERDVWGRASALAITAKSYQHGDPALALDGAVRDRLFGRRESYLASGKRPIAWVAGLDDAERVALLAELVAISLDLREDRTSSVSRAARAEAAEIAELCGAELSARWTPDEPFLRVHGKGQLVAFLEEMGVARADAGKLRKDELVAVVSAEAAERRWAPAALGWGVTLAVDSNEASDHEAGHE